ncbi:hypothetical protein STEG23_036200, partial [Scotinomys teguina]
FYWNNSRASYPLQPPYPSKSRHKRWLECVCLPVVVNANHQFGAPRNLSESIHSTRL